MSAAARGQLLRQTLGLLILCLGLGVIFFVLWLGFQMFKSPTLGLRVHGTPTATELGVGFGTLILRIALLFLGSISGSLVANKGIHLLFAAAPAGAPTDAHGEPIARPAMSPAPSRAPVGAASATRHEERHRAAAEEAQASEEPAAQRRSG